MSKANQASQKSTEQRRSADDVFKETIAALDRFNKYMFDAGYKVSKDMAAEVGHKNNTTGKQTKSPKKLKKAA